MNQIASATSNFKQAVPFFHVKNIEASVRFHVDSLGFALTKQWTPEGKLRFEFESNTDAPEDSEMIEE